MVWTVEKWRENLLRDVVKTFLCRFFHCRDWSKSLHEATMRLRNAICSVSTYSLYQGNRLHREPGLEEYHW